jgi:SAM-dependent methyltransferase
VFLSSLAVHGLPLRVSQGTSPPDASLPSDWVVRFAPLIQAGGRVLDLACGSGRHARYLAAAGYAVDAVDRDAAALAGLAGISGIHARVADLEGGHWPYPGARFAGIVVTNYLHRPLLPLLVAALRPGGVLIYETFAVGNERFGRPSNPAFLLRPGELLEMVRDGYEVLGYEHGETAGRRKAVVQRLCARRQI